MYGFLDQKFAERSLKVFIFVLDYFWSLWAGAGWQHRHVHHHLRVFQSLRRRGRLRLLIMVTPLSLISTHKYLLRRFSHSALRSNNCHLLQYQHSTQPSVYLQDSFTFSYQSCCSNKTSFFEGMPTISKSVENPFRYVWFLNMWPQ